jgi:hypothetical protein
MSQTKPHAQTEQQSPIKKTAEEDKRQSNITTTSLLTKGSNNPNNPKDRRAKPAQRRGEQGSQLPVDRKK